MSSHNLPLTDQSSIDNSCENLINKETQTSTAYITDSIELIKGPSRPLPKGIKSNIEGNINILDCAVIKVPSDSKTTAAFTESFIKEVENSNLSIDDNISNQSLYCKEVAIPFLKTHLSECEDDVESLEKLVQDALEEFHEQPCFEIYEGKNDIEEKTSKIKIIPTDTMSKSKEPQEASTMDNSTAKKSDKESENTPTPTPTPIPTPVSEDSSATKKSNENFEMQSEDKKSVSKAVYPNDVQKPVDAFDESNKDKEIDKKLSIECISECVQKGLTGLKDSASSCLEKIEIVIGIKKSENPDEKPTYYLIDKQKPDRNASQNAQTETGSSLNSIKNLLHDHNDKIITMTETVKDIAEKCYQGSKDAVTFITSESAKFLNKSKFGENDEQNSSDSQLKRIEKTLRNLSTDSIASILFKKAESKPIKEPSNTDRSDSEEIAETPCIAEPKPPSAIKLKLCQMRDDLVTAKLDKSSPYDNPIPKEVSNELPEPRESRIPTVSAIDRTPETPSASNMFTMLKSKFFSMFREEEQVTEPMIQENPQDEEEEDPFERFMEQ